MRIAKVRGQVTLSRCIPEFQGAVLKMGSIIGENEIHNPSQSEIQCDAPIVLWDTQSASVGTIVAFSEGAEAARPLKPKVIPIDASTTAIIDELEIPKK